MESIRKTKLGRWETPEDLLRYEKVARRMRIADQIADAMDASGIGKKQLADMLGKCPSEITKWLGGTQNFTADVLAEISHALGTEITGAEAENCYCRFSLLPRKKEQTPIEYKPVIL